jgi:hypothetical protein
MKHYLVQRLTSKSSIYESDTGFDRFFSLDYMGSSEFEWGAIPQALQRMRTRAVAAQVQPVTIGGVTRDVYFVGHAKDIASAASDLEEWARPEGRRPAFYGKEASHFPDAFAGVPDRWNNTDAWWSIDNDIAFALTEDIANRLVAAFNNKPRQKG